MSVIILKNKDLTFKCLRISVKISNTKDLLGEGCTEETRREGICYAEKKKKAKCLDTVLEAAVSVEPVAWLPAPWNYYVSLSY